MDLSAIWLTSALRALAAGLQDEDREIFEEFRDLLDANSETEMNDFKLSHHILTVPHFASECVQFMLDHNLKVHRRLYNYV